MPGGKALLREEPACQTSTDRSVHRGGVPETEEEETSLHVKADVFPSKMVAERNSSCRQTPCKASSRSPQNRCEESVYRRGSLGAPGPVWGEVVGVAKGQLRAY